MYSSSSKTVEVPLPDATAFVRLDAVFVNDPIQAAVGRRSKLGEHVRGNSGQGELRFAFAGKSPRSNRIIP